MPWQQDPQTGEWYEAMPDPTALASPSGPVMPRRTDEGYTTGDAGVYPIMSPQMEPEPSPEGGYSQRDVAPLPMRPEDQVGYQNEDQLAEDAWDEDVQARGNIVRYTPGGVFEVDPNTRRVISRRPTIYRMN